MQAIRKVAVIGAGPGGLVTAKYLLESHRALGTEPLEVKVFEAEDAIGGTFYARMYEDGEVRQDLHPPRSTAEKPSISDTNFAARKLQAAHGLLGLPSCR